MSGPLHEFFAACREREPGELTAHLVQATSAIKTLFYEDAGAFARAAGQLSSLPPLGQGWFALTLGAVVEGGCDANVSVPALIAALRAWLARLPGQAPTAEQELGLLVFRELCQATVAHLARAPKWHASLGADAEFLERLEDVESLSYGATWVREALRRVSGVVLLLHAPTGRGVFVRYANVGTCFHLFTLIQGCVGVTLPGGREPDERVLAVARGGTWEKVHDVAWWHYSEPFATQADFMASIWAESEVRDLLRVNGTQVIVLWPPVLASRGWDSGFFGCELAAMPPSAVVERELSEADAEHWFREARVPWPR